jgi:hypothetical protein
MQQSYLLSIKLIRFRYRFQHSAITSSLKREPTTVQIKYFLFYCYIKHLYKMGVQGKYLNKRQGCNNRARERVAYGEAA